MFANEDQGWRRRGRTWVDACTVSYGRKRGDVVLRGDRKTFFKGALEKPTNTKRRPWYTQGRLEGWGYLHKNVNKGLSI